MQNSKKTLFIAGLVAAIIAIGGVIGWLGGRGLGNNPVPVAITPPQPVEPPPMPSADVPVSPIPIPSSAGQNPSALPVTKDTNWESAVAVIVDSDAKDEDQAKQLFALFPKLPEEGKVAVADELADLVPDENYAQLGRLLKDASQPAAVLDVLMDDADSRPNSIELPIMLEIAQNPAHPKAAAAREILVDYLEQDYGNNWTQWQQKVKAWLQDNPD